MVSAEELMTFHQPDPNENPWVVGPPPAEPVVIVPYDDQWPARFDELDRRIRLALSDIAPAVSRPADLVPSCQLWSRTLNCDPTSVSPSDVASPIDASLVTAARHCARRSASAAAKSV